MPSLLRYSLSILQIICLAAMAVAGWFLLEHWTYVAAVAMGMLIATLYIELFYERRGD
jgi:Flp pilus assembly protein TadB